MLGEYEVLEDMLLDGLKIVQDTRLYRFTSDSVLLSKFARAKKGDTVADFCAGSGIVAFHFYALNRKRVEGLNFTLFELQESLSNLSKKTAEFNGFDNFSFVCGRLQDIPKTYNEKFSLILCNPPYGERLGDEEEAAELYKKMDELWNSFKGWDIGVITSHKSFQENFGHYANRLKDIKAGNLDTTLYIYSNSTAPAKKSNEKKSSKGKVRF